MMNVWRGKNQQQNENKHQDLQPLPDRISQLAKCTLQHYEDCATSSVVVCEQPCSLLRIPVWKP